MPPELMKDIVNHYNRLASLRDHYRKKNSYFYALLYKQYKYLVPKGKKVLEVGCSTGELLNVLEPSFGVGIDVSGEMIQIARQKYPHLEFHEGQISDLKIDEKFDYIILSGLLGELEDIQQFLKSLRKFCTNDTRVIIEYYSYCWQYSLKLGEKLRLKIPQKIQNWLTPCDIHNFLTLAGYEPVKLERCILFPLNILGISYILNKFIAKLPFLNALTLSHFIIARPLFSIQKEFSVSIVIPCRNEKGNIEPSILRTPKFGARQEFVFIEGGSTDRTYEEIECIIKKYPERDIKLYKQAGNGKGDVVNLGFNKATNENFMILDADLTTPPEDLPKFYEAIATNKGEFINGCRLVYPLEKESMRFLNLVANKLFGLFFSWLLGQTFKDTLCGTKVLFRHHYEELMRNRSYFGDFDPFGDFDLIFGITKLNLKVIELPTRYRPRQYGSTQIQRFRHGLLLMRMCLFAMKKIKFI